MRRTRVSLRSDDPTTGRVASVDRLTVMTSRMLARSSQARRGGAGGDAEEGQDGGDLVVGPRDGSDEQGHAGGDHERGEPGSGVHVADRAPGPDGGDGGGEPEVNPGLVADGVAGEEAEDGLVFRKRGVTVAATAGQVAQPVPD